MANQSLAPLTWFRVGGPAQVLFTPADEDDLAYFLSKLPAEIAVYVVGVGSNLIVRDGGIPGVVIRLSPRGFGETNAEGDIVRAGTAALDKRVAETAAAANIGGLEFYFGIPGSIGGALRMNAGANGGETKDVLVEAGGIAATAAGTLSQCRHEIRLPQQRRRSVDHLHLGALSRHRRQSRSDPRAHGRGAEPSRDRAADPREDRRIDLQESAGPQRLETDRRRGLRGFRVGGAQVSEMHCNFLINTGDATGHDIETLGETVRARVKENSGIELQWEIKRIGIEKN